MGTRGQWAIDTLKVLGNSKPDDKTVNLLAAWTKGEGTDARYNPLATTLPYGTYTKFNNCCGGNGVKNYPSRDAGIQATVRTISSNHPGYSDILAGLRGNDPERALKGMKYNVWGTNFTYVETLWRSKDVRNETLKSEDLSIPERIYGQAAKNEPVHAPAPIRPEDYNNGGSGVNPLGSDSGYNDPNFQSKYPDDGVTADSVRDFTKIYFVGVPLIGLSVVLIVIAAIKSDTVKGTVELAKDIL